ncbi:MAG: hypothetical protein ABI343_09575 [Burkholderiaceae bacterium]
MVAAVRAGAALEDATRASSYFPRLYCARAIVQSGIRALHTLPPDRPDPVWGGTCVYPRKVLEEGDGELLISDRDAAELHARSMDSDRRDDPLSYGGDKSGRVRRRAQ